MDISSIVDIYCVEAMYKQKYIESLILIKCASVYEKIENQVAYTCFQKNKTTKTTKQPYVSISVYK
jgi:hypothetical protein